MVKTLKPIDHIRMRLGMYVPTWDNKPTNEAWDVLLHELVADGVRAFARGGASRLEIMYNQDTGEVAIGHDGPDGNMCRKIAEAFQGFGSCMGGPCESPGYEPEKEVYLTRYDLLTYAILNALSQKMTVETYADGEWRANVCSDGKVGPEERLFSSLLPKGAKRFVWVRFVINPKYMSEDKGLSPYSADFLQDFGRSLAGAHQGLRVVVNKHEYMFPRGIEDMVAERLAKLDSEVLMRPRMARSNGMTLACGIVKRRSPGRKISGAAFINGREIRNGRTLAILLHNIGNTLSDCRRLQSCNYEFVFMAAGKVSCSADGSLSSLTSLCSESMTIGTYDVNSASSQYVLSLGRCLLKILGGFMR